MTAISKGNLGATFVLAVSLAALSTMAVDLNGVAPVGLSRGASEKLTFPVVSAYDYSTLRESIIYGRASLGEARRAMTERDPASLSNTIHALYLMRWHRGVVHLLNGMWDNDRKKYPELAWDLIAKRPARIALASTLNRVRIIKTEPQLEFIRSHRDDPHEFNRAQVAIALGYNGDPQDLQYLRDMGDGVNHYVAQSAVTALSLFGGEQARRALSELEEKHRGNPRGVLISQLLREAYDWPPFKPVIPSK